MVRAAALTLSLGVVACAADEARSPAGLDAAAPDAASAPDAPRVEPCAALELELDDVVCYPAQGTDSTRLEGFVAAAPASRLRFEPLVDGRCQVTLHYDGPGCVEEQVWMATERAGWDGAYTSGGIASCAPDGCGFVDGDDACVVGERAGAMQLETLIEVDDGVITRFHGAVGVCAALGFPIEEQRWVRGG